MSFDNNNAEITNDIVMSSRIRLARNVKSLPFPTYAEPEKIKQIVNVVFRELGNSGDYVNYPMNAIHEVDANVLRERHLISPDLIANKQSGAAIIRKDERISVMINEEDHVRLQCIINDFALREAYAEADTVDDILQEKIGYAFDESLGYLTSCPTNLGTGMRASVMLFLPALTMSGRMDSLITEVGRLRMTVRGVYGEGSNAEGSRYQISNQVSLGLSENEIINQVESIALEICSLEKSARKDLTDKHNVETRDKVCRAYGVLTNAAILDSKEFMSLFASVKLGAALGILSFKDKKKLENIILRVQPASMIQASGRFLEPYERDMYRAEYVSKTLKELSL